MASEQKEGFDVELLRTAVRLGKVEWQRHALERALEREITRAEALDVLKNGEQIENYPHAYPHFPGRSFWVGRITDRSMWLRHLILEKAWLPLSPYMNLH